MGGEGSGRGIWRPEKQERERRAMRLRHSPKIKRLLEQALLRMDRTEAKFSRVLEASEPDAGATPRPPE
jgi:hypothetical protein